MKAKCTFFLDESLFRFWIVLQIPYFEPNLTWSNFTQHRYYSFDHHVENWEDEQDEDEEEEADDVEEDEEDGGESLQMKDEDEPLIPLES